MQPLPDAPLIEAEEISTTAALEALCPEWSTLWERCPDATPFQTPEWLLPWWRRFGSQPGWELWSWTLRCEGRLVGLAPLFLQCSPNGALRQVSPVGVGITDYLDVLLDPGAVPESVGRLLGALAEHRDRWDVCDFEQLRPASPLLTAPVPPGLTAEVRQSQVCPVVPLPASAEEFVAGRAPWLRRNLRYGRRRLARTGDLRFETADRNTLGEYLDALFHLHRERWHLKGLPGVFLGEEIRDFHREVAEGLLARDLLRMHGMRLDGYLVALWYGLADPSRVYAYQSGFEPELAHLSPGTLIVGYAVEEAIRAGARELDFLRGSEPYKYHWGAHDQPQYRLRLRHTEFRED